MSHTTKKKDYPLSMRLPEADLAIIDRAALRLADEECERERDNAYWDEREHSKDFERDR
jgi:hypothetical protein